MKINPDDLRVNEALSNPAQVAMCNPSCPVQKPCFHVVVGFGTLVEFCPDLKEIAGEAVCEHPSAG